MKVSASLLNVRSGPGVDFRVLSQLARGTEVRPLETHGDWAWVDPSGGWVSRAYLETPMVAVPEGLYGIEHIFGKPGTPACSAGRAVLPRPLKLGWSSASVTRVACHVLLEEVFSRVFWQINDAGLWPMLHTFDGIYSDRSIRGATKPSTHAWGIAIDLNASTNAQGTAGDLNRLVVSLFEQAGFIWGGKWPGKRRDPMHLQYASGY